MDYLSDGQNVVEAWQLIDELIIPAGLQARPVSIEWKPIPVFRNGGVVKLIGSVMIKFSAVYQWAPVVEALNITMAAVTAGDRLLTVVARPEILTAGLSLAATYWRMQWEITRSGMFGGSYTYHLYGGYALYSTYTGFTLNFEPISEFISTPLTAIDLHSTGDSDSTPLV